MRLPSVLQVSRAPGPQPALILHITTPYAAPVPKMYCVLFISINIWSTSVFALFRVTAVALCKKGLLLFFFFNAITSLINLLIEQSTRKGPYVSDN